MKYFLLLKLCSDLTSYSLQNMIIRFKVIFQKTGMGIVFVWRSGTTRQACEAKIPVWTCWGHSGLTVSFSRIWNAYKHRAKQELINMLLSLCIVLTWIYMHVAFFLVCESCNKTEYCTNIWISALSPLPPFPHVQRWPRSHIVRRI